MNSRYYNPEWGRFINADGLVGKPGELLSHNMFMYCANNPINREDPTGRWSISSLKKAVNNFVLEASIFVYVNIRVAQTIISNKVTDVIGKIFNSSESSAQLEQKVEQVVTKGKDIVGSEFNEIKPTQTEINPGRVQHYVNKLTNGEKVSPVEVVSVPEKGKFLVEGHHRFVASQLTGIPVEIIESQGAGPVGMPNWSDTEWLQWDGFDWIYK